MMRWRPFVQGLLATMTLIAMPVDARVIVTFVSPDSYTDIGDLEQDPRVTLAEIKHYLERLGELYLPTQLTLRIDFLDISLAGRPRWPRQANAVTRAMTGEADWPRFDLRYTLESGSTTSAPVEETVVDRIYLRRLEWRYEFRPLPYEKRMLEEWFRARFAEHAAQSASLPGG